MNRFNTVFSRPVHFAVVAHDDLWEVLCNGRLTGGYVSHAGATQAAHAAISGIQGAGGQADLVIQAVPVTKV